MTRGSMAAIPSYAANFHTCTLYCVYFYQTPKTFPLFSLPQKDTFTRKSSCIISRLASVTKNIRRRYNVTEGDGCCKCAVVAHTWKESPQIWGNPSHGV